MILFYVETEAIFKGSQLLLLRAGHPHAQAEGLVQAALGHLQAGGQEVRVLRRHRPPACRGLHVPAQHLRGYQRAHGAQGQPSAAGTGASNLRAEDRQVGRHFRSVGRADLHPQVLVPGRFQQDQCEVSDGALQPHPQQRFLPEESVRTGLRAPFSDRRKIAERVHRRDGLHGREGRLLPAGRSGLLALLLALPELDIGRHHVDLQPAVQKQEFPAQAPEGGREQGFDQDH